MALDIDTTLRDNVIKGDIHSGAHNPDKAELRALLKTISGAAGNPSIVKQTKAALDAVTPSSENYGGLVLNDPDPTKNGYYYRSSAAWVKGRGFPDTFAFLSGATGVNTVSASTDSDVNPADIRLFLLTPPSTNTGAMTLSISGGTALPLNDFDGMPLSAGYVQAGKPVLLHDNGDSTYRLVIDHRFQVLADQVAEDRDEAEVFKDEAEAARDIAAGYASDAVSQGNVPIYATMAGVAALTVPVGINAFRVNGYAADGDGGAALWVEADVQSSGPGKRQDAAGRWFQISGDSINPIMLGAAGNGDGAGGGTNDHDVLEETFAAAAALGVRDINGLGLTYRADAEVSYTAAGGGRGFRLVDLDFDFTQRGAGNCLSFSGGTDAGASTNYQLVSNATRGDESVTINDTTGLSVGDWIALNSGTAYWASSTSTSRTEHKRVTGLPGAGVVEFDSPLDYGYPTSGGSKIIKLNFLEDMELINCSALGDGTTDQAGINFYTCLNPRLVEPNLRKFFDRAVRFASYSRDMLVDQPIIRDCERSGTGYGVVFGGGSEHGLVAGGDFFNCRHPVTGGGTEMVRHCFAKDCVGQELKAGFDFHPAADMCGWEDCYSYMSSAAVNEDGFSYQGNRLVARGCHTYFAVRQGMLIQPLVTDLGGAPSYYDAEVFAIESGGDAISFSPQNAITIDHVDLKAVVKDSVGRGLLINLGSSGATVKRLVVDGDIVVGSGTTNRAVHLLSTTASGGRVGHLWLKGYYERATGGVNLIEINGDSGAATSYVNVLGATLIGGTNAIRTVQTNTKVKAHGNSYSGQSSAFTSLAGSSDSLANNVSL